MGMLAVLLLTVTGLNAQAPGAQVMTADQVEKTKADLENQARFGGLLLRAASCEAQMLDVAALKKRVADLEALAKKANLPSPAAPVSQKD
jgi:hypothetical protein